VRSIIRFYDAKAVLKWFPVVRLAPRAIVGGCVGEKQRVRYVAPALCRQVGLNVDKVAPADGGEHRPNQVLFGNRFGGIPDLEKIAKKPERFGANSTYGAVVKRFPCVLVEDAFEQEIPSE